MKIILYLLICFISGLIGTGLVDKAFGKPIEWKLNSIITAVVIIVMLIILIIHPDFYIF